jgi:hypothetical protein
VGAEPTSSGPVELRDYPAVLGRRLAQPEPVAAVAAKVAADHRHPAQLLEHVQVDVAANSQILRVRYRYRPPSLPIGGSSRTRPSSTPLLVVKHEHLVADPEDTLAPDPGLPRAGGRHPVRRHRHHPPQRHLGAPGGYAPPCAAGGEGRSEPAEGAGRRVAGAGGLSRS